MQFRVLVHATSDISNGAYETAFAETAYARGCSRHAEPSHRTFRPLSPTAIQKLALMQLTPANRVEIPVASAVHVAPSQRAIVPPSPTAAQAFAAAQATPKKAFAVGDVCALHVPAPLRRAIVPPAPTDTQMVALVH
jgi:hypothetical protein